jgi:hypothetical protein
MYKNCETAPTRPATSRPRLNLAYCAVFLSTLALSGCATFSPDVPPGMNVPTTRITAVQRRTIIVRRMPI